jgi:hypothetical protein
MAAAAAEASVAAKVPAVAAVKSLPDRLDGWQPKRERKDDDRGNNSDYLILGHVLTSHCRRPA